ncbi:pyridoxal phosphate-dependent decarboxylase family protein [Phenylobacterium sp.]|jgi:glutamate/tyrosine decarboxylase-like PLP-dependent enzyme|uniref:pyridoxal phosphate-dependent decarboxylase family protein n=1 Tax=Phenylobacterium sp. TaxID=1871053 RepID=UPI002E32F2AC|nr:aminotransferase class V-fold PLP-dependent enzyme [Phenylobacterium sp.]HEX4710606.1 aminotransferase class V-fold PLP-dependent enzyme [Phenylobacterium sp.]
MISGEDWRNAIAPPREARDRLLAHAAALVSRRLGSLTEAGPLNGPLDREAIRDRLSQFDFDRPVDLADAASELAALLGGSGVQSAHARCFGLFNPTPAFPGVVADMLAAAWNPQLAVWSHASGAVEAEHHVLAHVARRLEFPNDAGASHFTTGGSEANATALNVALTRLFPAFADHGLAGLSSRPRIYASAESHLAWLKIAHQAGLGRDALRLVDVDGAGRLDLAALDRALARDIAAGHAPTMVIATAGTTNAGILDPIEGAVAAARSAGAHIHVDAAWAGAAAFSDRLRPRLVGISLADSITVDAHKWLSAPMGAGMFFCRRKDWLAAAFRVSTDYMPQDQVGLDPYVLSQQWSRRLVGLRLLLILAALGREGVARQIEHQADMGDLLRTKLAAAGWRVINDSPLPVVCYVDPAGADPSGIAQRVVDRGRVWISPTRTQGVACLRSCITSFLVEPADLDILVEELDAARQAPG